MSEQNERTPTIYGFEVPPGNTVAWGARAICTGSLARGTAPTYFLDILPDRQQNRGAEEHPEEFKALLEWVNKKGLPFIRKAVSEGDPSLTDGSSRDVTTYASDGYEITASPNASYGYIYIAAWPRPAAVAPPGDNAPGSVVHTAVADNGHPPPAAPMTERAEALAPHIFNPLTTSPRSACEECGMEFEHPVHKTP